MDAALDNELRDPTHDIPAAQSVPLADAAQTRNHYPLRPPDPAVPSTANGARVGAQTDVHDRLSGVG